MASVDSILPLSSANLGRLPAHSNRYYDLDENYADRTAALGHPPLFDEFVAALGAPNEVIDLGCGAGRELAALKAAGIDCKGFDLSSALAAKARIVSGADVVVADMRQLEFINRSLNGVVAVASLLHLEPSDVEMMLHRIKNWLVHRGPFLATMKLGEGQFVDAVGRRFTLFGEEDWLNLLESTGFCVENHIVTRADRRISTSAHDWIATLVTHDE